MNGKCASASTFLQVVILTILTLAAAGNSIGASGHNQPIFFTENAGQWDSNVLFRATEGNATVWLTGDGILYALSRHVGQPPEQASESGDVLRSEHLVFGVKFIGSNPRSEVYGVSEKDFYHNYFLGNDPTQWKTSVPNYDTIVYHELYPGIDMKYYGKPDGIEYTFTVAPGSDPSAIKLRYEGVESVRIDKDGRLLLSTVWGTLEETIPAVYQVTNGKRVDVGASYRIEDDGSIGFRVDSDYKSDAILVIDPELTFSSYLGGTGAQYPSDIKEDSQGNIVIMGHTRSVDFPITVGAYQETFAGGVFDVFITKVSRLTNQIIYSTFLGGSGRDEEPKMDFGPQEDVYITGRTYSDDFPLVNPLQATLNGTDDSYVLKMNPTCDQLLYSTFLGGSKEEDWSRIAVDTAGYICVSGITTSSDFPTVNPYSSELNGGQFDGFVTKYYPAGDAMVYSTYIGGRQDEELECMGVTKDGEVVVAGLTHSDDYPMVNSLYPCLINPDALIDAIITKFSSDGSYLIFSTYISGTQDEWFEDLVLDDDGNIYVVGGMETTDFEIVNSFQPDHCPIAPETKGSDMFVAGVSAAGDEVLFAGFLCGSYDDYGTSIDLGPDGSIYVTGVAESNDFTLASPIDATFDGESDMVLARISPDGTQLIYSTYFGGSDDDYKPHVGAGNDDCVHITGSTYSDDIPMVNAFQPYSLANYDLFLATICGGCCMGDRGNFDGDVEDELNVADLVAMANWAFRGGPPAPCYQEADLNSDGVVNLWDLLFMVDYLYRFGPAPGSCE